MQLVWFVHLWQPFNQEIWLLNLNKWVTNAEGGTLSLSIKNETEQYHLKKSSVLIRIWFTECYIELNKKINNYHLVSKVEDYDPGRLKYLWFSLDWECSICTVAKMRGLAYQRMVKRKKGKPDATEKTTLKCYKVYSNCFQQLYQGSNDSVSKYWSSWRYKVSPGNDLVNSRTTLQIVASCVIKNHAGTPFSSTLGPKKKLIRTSAEASTRTN